MLVRLCTVQLFSLQIMHFFSNIFADSSSFGKRRHIPLNLSSLSWPARFHLLMVNMLFSMEYSIIQIALMKSGILDVDTGRAVGVARPLCKGTIVRY